MAETHHFWYKRTAEEFRDRMNRKGYSTSMAKTKKGYSVTVWRD